MPNSPTRAEEAREADCASEWRQIERAWRDAGLPEWFLGNGSTNHGLYRFVDKVRALSAARAEAEVARLIAELAQMQAERDAAIKVCDMNAMSGGFSARWAENATKRAEAAEARVAALETALKPFAKLGALFGPRTSENFDQLIYGPAAGPEYNLTGDHLRAAVRALHGGDQ